MGLSPRNANARNNTNTQDIIFSNITPSAIESSNANANPIRKIVVFDMDETLGIFSDFGAFMEILNAIIISRRKSANHNNANKANNANNANNVNNVNNANNFNNNVNHPKINIYDHFNEILDMYPELLRPRILEIMLFLAKMKRAGKCNNVMIYTNNSGPISWSHQIKDYFNKKAGYVGPQWIGLFDKVIGAFKRPNGELVEVRRTTHDKTYSDFVQCTNMTGKFEVFFIDDREHPGMHAENVYVINVKPYTRELSMRDFMARFAGSALFNSLHFTRAELADSASTLSKRDMGPAKEYTKEEAEVDKMVGATILEKLREFFDIPPVSSASSASSTAVRKNKSMHSASAARRKHKRGTGTRRSS